MAVKKKSLSELDLLMKDHTVSASDGHYTLKQRCDRLTAYLHVALTQLEAEGRADFIFLKHDEIRNWWIERQAAIRAHEEAQSAKQRKAELKLQALAKLSMEERRALGIK
jgi:hypothetical protein